MTPTYWLAALLALLPLSFIGFGVWQLRPHPTRYQVSAEGVVEDVSPSHSSPRMTITFTALDGTRVTGDSTEGFTGARAGDPVNVWFDPTDPRHFTLCEPGYGDGLSIAAIVAGVLMLIFVVRVAFLHP